MKSLLVRYGVFTLCALPLLGIIAGILSGGLGPDPADALMHATGEWSARFLVLCLLMTPMRRWTGNPFWLRQRRLLGLFAFFYACLHLLIFLQLFLGWSAARILEELAERPYITAGFLAWLIMLPMAATSTRAAQRRLGRNWTRLHRGIYIAAIAATLHIFWQARSDLTEPLAYAAAFAALLAYRALSLRPPR